MANTRAQQTTLISTNLPDNTTKSITPLKVRQVENAGVSAYAFVDDDNDFTGVNNHTKEVRWHKGADLASATALALGVTGNYHHVTGSTEIETLSTKQHGTRMVLYFEGAPNLKHSSNLLLGGQDIQMVAGSSAEFISEGGGVWRLIQYKGATSVYTFFNGIPGVNQDSTQGYVAGKSRIIDYNTQFEYFCYSDAVGAANWVIMGVNDLNSNKYGIGSGVLNGATNGNAIGNNAGYSNTGARLNAFGNGAGSGNTADDVLALGHNAGQANTIPNSFIISNSNLPSFADFVTASAALAGGVSGNTYLYHDQATNSIGAVRL